MHNTRLRSRAYCAHTDARPAYLRPAKSTWRPVGSGFFSGSDSIDFNFKKILNSPERERCRKVHIDACIQSDAQCSSKARLSSAKYMTSSQIGFLDTLNMPLVWHDGLPVPVFKHALSRIHVRVHVDLHGILIEFRQVASRQSWRCACLSGVCQLPLLRLRGFNDQRHWLSELADTRSSSPHNALHSPSIPTICTLWGTAKMWWTKNFSPSLSLTYPW